MALTKGKKKRILCVVAAVLAFVLLAVSFNASWVQSILNPNNKNDANNSAIGLHGYAEENGLP